MPFDREGTLRKAEKLLRQGKLDLAIAEYRAVIEDQPSDWNTANTLGDLYFRAGQVEKAIAEYNKIAEHLGSEGFFPKAVALYKKILKIKPDEEKALWHLGNISARQGLMLEARLHFSALADRRRARGDKRGEAEVRARLGDLDGADIDARLAGARARVELGDTKTAVERLKTAAADLQEKGKDADALRLLTEASQLDPDDQSLRALLMQSYLTRGDFEAASQFATSAADLRVVADELFRLGRDDEGLNVLSSAAEAEPGDLGLRVDLVKRLMARGDADGARQLLTPEVAGSDPDLLWMLAEMELRAGRTAEGIALLREMIAADPGRRDAVVILGCSVAETYPDGGYQCIDLAASTAIAADEWASAAAALNEFVSRNPGHIPGLMRLVEVCVDGGLEATMYTAQAQLADAYLAAGLGVEARVIAEDLVAREPWDRANIERFRRALTLLGEANVDGIIAERLSGQKPFVSTDFHWPADQSGTEIAPMPVEASDPEPPAFAVPSPAPDLAAPPPSESAPPEGAPAVRSEGAGGERPAPPAPAPAAKADMHEIDLSEVLQDLRKEEARAGDAAPGPAIEPARRGKPDPAGHDSSAETAEQHFRLAGTYMEKGMHDEAMKALQAAARSPRHRFRAGAMLGKAYLAAGDHLNAIEWYGMAVEAPAPSPEAHHALLYDLALVLEQHGESARALAVLLELQSEAGEYRDVSTRLEQLKVQMGG